MTENPGRTTSLVSPTAGLVFLVAASSGVVSLLLHPNEPVLGGLVAGLVVVAGAAGWSVTRRPNMAVASSAAVSAWPLTYFVSWPFLVAALAIGGFLLVPPLKRTVGATVVIVVAGTLAFFALEPAVAGPIAALVAGVLVLLRPDAPTEGVIRTVRSVALFLPAVGIVGGLIINAASGEAEHFTASQAVSLGWAIAGLWALCSLALLGLATLVESSDPVQNAAWSSGAMGVGLLSASLSTLDAGAVIASFAAMVVPLIVLAVLALGRVGAAWPSLRYGLPFVAAAVTAAQWGIQL